MAKAFLTDVDLSKNVLLNAKIQAWSVAPTGTTLPTGSGIAIEGMISSYKGALYIYKNSDSITAWQQVGGSITIGSTSIASGGTAGTTGTPLSGVFFDGSGVTFKGSTSGTTVLKSAATAGSGTLTLPTATGTLVGTGDTGVVTNTMLQNSTISGVSLGSNLATLTFSAELGSGTYNGNGTLTVTPRAGTTAQTGIVSLTDSISSTSTTTAATPNSVKTAYDLANAALPKTGGTMTGNIAMSGYTLTGLGEPVNGSDAATKNYVDNVSQGINVHEGVAGLIDTNLVGTYVPGGGTATSVSGSSGSKTLTVTNSGFNIAVGQTVAGNANIPTGSVVVTAPVASGTGITVTIDKNLTGSLTNATGVTFLGADGGTGVGATFTVTATGVLQSTDTNSKVTFALNDRVLITGQTTTTQNGVYVVTTAGAVGVQAVLVRAADFDNSTFGDVNSGDLVYVAGGGNGSGAKSFGGTQWVQTTVGTVTSGSGSTVLKSVKIDTDAIAFTQFSGTGAVAFSATNVVTTATNTTNATYYPTFGSVNTSGSQGLGTDTDLSYNPSTNTLTAGTFSGALSGNATTATSATGVSTSNKTDSVTYYPVVSASTATQTNTLFTTSNISWNSSTAIISALGLTGTSLTFSTSSNGDINLSPNGTGSVRVAGTTPTVSTANATASGSGSATTSNITISTGNASITSPTGAPQATSGNLTIDVGSATGATGGTNTTGTVTIGGTNARAVIIDTGSAAGTGGSSPVPGVLNLGTTSARTINIGSTTGATGVAINSGTGNLVINATGTNAEVQITANGTGSGIQIGSSAGSATNTITMGLSNGTGTITLGRSTDSQTVAIANGAVASTKTKTVNIGTGGSVGTTTISIGGSANSTTTVNGTFQLGSSVLSLAGGNFSTATGAITLTAQAGGSSVTLPTSGTLATLAGTEALTGKTYNGLTLTAAATGFTIAGGTTSKTLTVSNSITVAGTDGKTITVNKNLTLDGTDGTTMTFPSTSATIARTDAGQTFTGTQIIDSINAASATATTTALYGNTTSGTITIGGAVGSTAATGTINIGNNAGIAGGTKAINLGTSATAGTTTITVGSTTGSTTTIRGAVQVPEVGTSGFVKAGASGALSTASIAYSDLPTITNGRVARTVSSSATMNGVATTIVANHALNSRPVNAQLFDSNYNLVETDVTLTDANNVTFTFAVAPANTTIYYWVVTG